MSTRERISSRSCWEYPPGMAVASALGEGRDGGAGAALGGAPGRCSATSGWALSTSSTARRRAPVPLPWMMRTDGSPARNASSRYFSSRSRASSVVRPIRCSSHRTALLPGVAMRAPSPWPSPRGGEGTARPLPSGRGLGEGPRDRRAAACIGTFTVTAPACTVAVPPSTRQHSPLSPRCAISTRSPAATGPAPVRLGPGGSPQCAPPAARSPRRRLRARSSSGAALLGALEPVPLLVDAPAHLGDQPLRLRLGARDGLARARRAPPRARPGPARAAPRSPPRAARSRAARSASVRSRSSRRASSSWSWRCWAERCACAALDQRGGQARAARRWRARSSGPADRRRAGRSARAARGRTPPRRCGPAGAWRRSP